MPRKQEQKNLIRRPFTYNQQNKPVPVSNPQIINHRVEQPGLLSSVMQGFAWGTGTTIARNMFDNHSSTQTPIQRPSKPTPSSEQSCILFNLCKQLDAPYICYSKLDPKEYEFCRTK